MAIEIDPRAYSPICRLICNHEPTREPGRLGTLVGDGKWLTVGEAVERFAGLASESTVRRLADSGELRSTRLRTGRRDRRILAEDVDRIRTDMEAEAEQSGGTEQPG